MSRRGFLSTLAQIQREAERAARARARAESQAAREALRTRRAYERALATEVKERTRLYVESRVAEVEELNDELKSQVAELENLLGHTISVDDFLDLERLKTKVEIPAFVPGALAAEVPKPRREDFVPPAPKGMAKFVPGQKAKHEEAVKKGEEAYEAALSAHRTAEAEREAALATARAQHDELVARLKEEESIQHKEIESLKADLEAGSAEAIVAYAAMVLEASSYPESFPQHSRMAFVPESKQLVVDYQLPPFDVIPAVAAYKYVKARDEITETPRPAKQRRDLYSTVVTQVTLRCIHEILEADRHGHIESIVFSGYVDTVDPATGQAIRPYVVSVRTTRDAFLAIDLARVDPVACLRGLNASVSKSPSELVPVRPVLEFNMVDPRFVEEIDVLSTLDTRPNLMSLTPSEFESLITNLFEKMGLETRMTQASRDGGVDCVAYDPRPIFGGKVVIQAKRYKNTVGVSAVRDLFGTMQNEGASKGILVTTSGYGKAAFEFAEGKPLELLSGTNLLYLLAEHAGIEAKIEPPEDWRDPVPDSAP